MTSLSQVVAYLDEYLRIREVPDYPKAVNGLQLENSGSLTRLVAAVDASQAAIDWASSSVGTLLMVHHGLFWSGLEPLTGRHGRRIRALVGGDAAVYSAHLPLDCHPEVGNNAVLARALGVTAQEPFGAYRDTLIGIAGTLEIERDELASRMERALGASPRIITGGPGRLKRIGIVTGAASSLLEEARDVGLDTFVTGEAPHHAYLDAEEWGLNLVLGGHYATETVGVKALTAHVADRFDLPWEFFDHPTGL